MDYMQTILDADARRPESLLSVYERKQFERGVAPKRAGRFLEIVARLDLGPEVVHAYWHCPERRERALRDLRKQASYQNALPVYKDLLRRMAEVGLTRRDAAEASGGSTAVAKEVAALREGRHPTVEWVVAAEALIAERGGDARVVDRAAAYRERLERFVYFRSSPFEVQEALVELAVAGIDAGEVAGAAGLSVNWLGFPADRRGPTSTARWITSARVMLASEGQKRAGAPVVDPDWTETQMDVYRAIWYTEDGTVATAAEKYPNLNIRHVLLDMRIPTETWP